jgi:hypothetical protein
MSSRIGGKVREVATSQCELSASCKHLTSTTTWLARANVPLRLEQLEHYSSNTADGMTQLGVKICDTKNDSGVNEAREERAQGSRALGMFGGWVSHTVYLTAPTLSSRREG